MLKKHGNTGNGNVKQDRQEVAAAGAKSWLVSIIVSIYSGKRYDDRYPATRRRFLTFCAHTIGQVVAVSATVLFVGIGYHYGVFS